MPPRGRPISLRQRLVNFNARYVQKPVLSRLTSQSLLRALFDLQALVARRPPGFRTRADTLRAEGHAVPCTWIDTGGPTGRGTILFLHGGAFTIGSLKGYAHVVGWLAHRAGMAGLFVDYRLAPEHPYPAAPDDALTAYRSLLARGHAPGRIALVGDSAGGNLVFGLLHRIGALGLPMPGAVAAMSPVLDLAEQLPSVTANADSDMLISPRWGARVLGAYLDGTDPDDPVISPLRGTFRGAPPVLLQVVTSEMLYDDSVAMAARLRAQGVTVRLDEWDGVPHVWHINVGWTPEADRGIADIADFLRQTLPPPPGEVAAGPHRE